ncbi:GumC family protein [Glacieibacterium megasporae]|uniref:GumC family protein n=1 Tax=Glacieibacterium megasporae TaxID=2835787 RepID=UPI001C1DE855|nr:Wzz/FepE/Etk N-terminal domain-containing protein [Polymorphobacter megasporae]UAJ11593.1 lipopolysaccharide biosynthesis protein [Polymorphobacter megasporae]
MTALEPYRTPERREGAVAVSDRRRSDRPSADRLDFRHFIAALRRRLGLLFGVTIAVVAAAALFVTHQPYVYSATAEIVLNTRDDQIAPTSAQAGSELPNADRADTEVEVLKSRALAESVAAALQLDANPAFNPTTKASPGIAAGLRTAVGLGGAAPRVRSPAETQRAIVDTLQSNLKVTRSDQTFALDVTYNAASATDAASIANEFARQYIAGQLRRKTDQNRSAITLLSSRLDSLQRQAQSDAERVQGYRIAHNLLSTSGSSLTEQEISSYNLAVTTARAQAVEDRARLNTARAQLRGGSNGGDAGEALDSTVVGRLREREAEVSGRLATLTDRYGAQYPDVAKTRSELADVQGQIKNEIGRIISNLEARVSVSQQRLDSLTGSLATARGGLADTNRSLAGLNDLDRRAKASQAVYESYLNRYKESVAQDGTEHADARLLSNAEPPLMPSSPKVLLSLIVAAVLGVGLGIAVAILTELQFTGLTTSEDVERRLGLAYLGGIPLPTSVMPRSTSPVDLIFDDPKSGFAEVFRSLRETLRQAAGEVPHVIAVTSSLPGESIAMTAACFARGLALSGETTILVDCDVREQGVATAFGLSSRRTDIVDILEGKASLDEAIVFDEATGLGLLLADAASDRGDQLVFGTRVEDLFTQLRIRFSYVVIATAPLLPVAETRSIVALADATLLLVRWRSTADHAVRAAMRLLSIKALKTTGVVLTNIDMRRQAKYGASDQTAYFEHYKTYYR